MRPRIPSRRASVDDEDDSSQKFYDTSFNRNMWLMMQTLSTIVMLLQVSEHTKTYLSYYTYTNVTMITAKELEFPAVTICNLNPYNKSIAIEENAFTEYLIRTNTLSFMETTLNYTDSRTGGLNNGFSHNFVGRTNNELKNFFVTCVQKWQLIYCDDFFTPRMTELGVCFTFNGPDRKSVMTSSTGNTSSLTMYIKVERDNFLFDTGNNIKVVLHDKFEEPNIREKGFLAVPGYSTYASVSSTKYKYLGRPYRSLPREESYCMDTGMPSFSSPLVFYSHYSYSACMIECRQNYTARRCKCRSHTDPGNDTICTPMQFVSCYKPKASYFEMRLQQTCNCPFRCESMSYSANVSSVEFLSDHSADMLHDKGFSNLREYAEIRIYFNDLNYTVAEQVPKMLATDFLYGLGWIVVVYIIVTLITLLKVISVIIDLVLGIAFTISEVLYVIIDSCLE
ncbi:acid-sensing ion channel 2-like [Mizuhopecten yessoensis]|uniref:acid-sensing ion channel 2-like n=1 Tax=Mizuhopecten yessoensis TaxID=6573 RepID=UPI000B45EBC0|nr:acid-sensing ion channel 2-like [Mizuhopecten yessoensis]